MRERREGVETQNTPWTRKRRLCHNFCIEYYFFIDTGENRNCFERFWDDRRQIENKKKFTLVIGSSTVRIRTFQKVVKKFSCLFRLVTLCHVLSSSVTFNICQDTINWNLNIPYNEKDIPYFLDTRLIPISSQSYYKFTSLNDLLVIDKFTVARDNSCEFRVFCMKNLSKHCEKSLNITQNLAHTRKNVWLTSLGKKEFLDQETAQYLKVCPIYSRKRFFSKGWSPT